MDAMLKACKSVEMDGLVWGANKLVPVGYGINKLQLMCVVEDEKVRFDTPLCYAYLKEKPIVFTYTNFIKLVFPWPWGI